MNLSTSYAISIGYWNNILNNAQKYFKWMKSNNVFICFTFFVPPYKTGNNFHIRATYLKLCLYSVTSYSKLIMVYIFSLRAFIIRECIIWLLWHLQNTLNGITEARRNSVRTQYHPILKEKNVSLRNQIISACQQKNFCFRPLCL